MRAGPGGIARGGPSRAGTRIAALVLATLPAALLAPSPAVADDEQRLEHVLTEILELPYSPDYAPAGIDEAFGDEDYPAAFPLTDTSTGTCCTSPVADQPPLADLAPPFARFPEPFELIELRSFDGTPLHAQLALEPGAPGVVVMHGFNVNGKHSVVRYAAFLHANGFSVIVPDHRDMGREWERGGSWWPDGGRRGQSLGWKEAEDLLVAARELRARGAAPVGALGFSEGAQNTILALGRDLDGWIDAALTFSGPADQRTQLQREAAATAALMTSVVDEPDVCAYLDDVGDLEEFSATPNFMLRQASAIDVLDGRLGAGVDAPGLHLYAADDALVPDYHATLLASRTLEHPLQHTLLVTAGNHAYFYDRWWTQAATLAWFRTWLDPEGEHTRARPTVTQPPAGRPLGEQTIDLDDVTREQADAERREEDLCEPAQDAVGPRPLLRVSGEGAERRLDARRSYSGWDHHEVVGWRLDPGDGSAPRTGDDVHAALLDHTYPEPGTYEASLQVTDDTGRSATTTRTIEVAGADDPTGGDDAPPAGPDEDTRGEAPAPESDGGTDRANHSPSPSPEPGPELPASGGGLALLGALGLAVALGRRRR